MRKFDLSLRSSRSSYFATFRHQLTILSKTDALDEEKWHLLEGFPFIQEPPSGDLQERVLIRHHDYDQCFQSVQLLQWNSQVKFNVTVYRNLPTTRDSIMTS